MTLRARLTLWNAIVLTLSLFTSGAAVHLITFSKLIADVDRELLAEAVGHKDFPAQLEAAKFGNGSDFGKLLLKLQTELAKRRPTNPEIEAVRQMPIRIFKADQVPLLGSSIESEETYSRESFQAALSGTPDYRSLGDGKHAVRVISYPIEANGRTTYVIQSTRPITAIYRTMHALDHVLLQLLPFALLLAIGGGAFLTGRSLRPIASLAASAESITAESLDLRLPIENEDELGRLARVVNGMLSRLEGSFEAQKRFVADASHELRTPLTSLKANTSLALSGPPDLTSYGSALLSADKAADAMTSLVNDLLYLSQTGSIQACSINESIDLGELVLQSESLFSEQCNEAGITLMHEVDGNPVVYAKAEQTLRLLSNLISNAIRHTPRGGTICLRTLELEETIALEVVDTGVGIAPEHLPHIFERFYRADDARNRNDGGFGLGLSICKTIVEANNGTVSVSSSLGTGTKVTITLPKGTVTL